MSEQNSGSLLLAVRYHLKTTDQSLHTISLATALPIKWLEKMKAEKIHDPSVNRIQTLYEYFTNEKLVKEVCE